MNRFRTKKKVKEPTEGPVRASTDSDGPVAAISAPTIKVSKTLRRGKKDPEPERQPLDLANALPSSDDFRTSLLMSGLSARFSMLREQDDPKSKIGKASDDSVLFSSKRQSRLNDFGFASHGLSDIAEVSSINGSIRPPFAFSRTDSYNALDGYGTDDDSTHGGSIMNRAKPGEGNNLFGGRQKIYKIPVNGSTSTKNMTEGGGSMGGRALYENDVSQSAFQKLREREREQQRQEEAEQNSQPSRAESPPPSGYNRNRETSSTTSSGGPSITRTSTAATSVTSQRTPSLTRSYTPVTGAPVSAAAGLDRTMTKSRRLYETGLDQHLHEQQYSAMNRIDTLTRQRALGASTPPPSISSPAGNNLSDRWDRQQVSGKASMPNMRAASPPPNAAAIGSFDFALRPAHVPETKPAFVLASPPLSPLMSENDDQAVLAVQPNDRGKATALGAFSKPVQPYDENKYSQRQLQMQQGRETPPLRKHSPPRGFAPRQQQQPPTGLTHAESNATFASSRSRSNSSAQRVFLTQERILESTQYTTTFASGRSRSNSSAQTKFLPQDRIPEVTTPNPQASVPEDEPLNPETFLSSPNGGSLGSHDDVEPTTKANPQPIIFPSQIYRQNQQQTLERPPESQHPANRPQPLQKVNTTPPLKGGQSPSVPASNTFSNAHESSQPVSPSLDSPTLGPTTGLSGMVRQHLRSDSNTSSVYGGLPSAGLTSRFPHDPTEPLPQNEYTTKSNPWDKDEWDRSSYEENKFSLESVRDGTKGQSAIPPPLSLRSPNMDSAVQEPKKAPWERQLDTHHERNGSSDTQKERQDFKAELATRRKRVQENMRSFVEIESRSASPAPTPEWSREGLARSPALGLLKTKTSRGSLIGRPKDAGQAKAMKMLGIGTTTISTSSSPGKSSIEGTAWKEEKEELLGGAPQAPVVPPPTKAFRQARRDAQRDRERQVALRHQQRMAAEPYGNDADWSSQPVENQTHQYEPVRDKDPPSIRTGRRTPSKERGPPPVTQNYRNGSIRESRESIGTTRSLSRTSGDRSSSDASGRSKSRNGRYRDELTKAMAEGMAEETASLGQGAYDELEPPSSRLMPNSQATPSLATQPFPIPSPVIGSNPTSRNRSNSKSTPADYLNAHKLQPLQTGEGIDSSLSPRPSPVTPYSVNSSPSLIPSPAISGANTPTIQQGIAAQGRIPGGRKRSINKSEISEPKFLSTTSRVPTVDLPPGSSLQNGIVAPPIPPVNPRRRQTRAKFGFGKKDDYEDLSLPEATQSTEEMSTFSADENDKPRARQKLRKTSSEGGNLNARARQAAFSAPSPAMPGQPFQGSGSPPQVYEGGMF